MILDDEILNAYLDEELDAETRKDVEATLTQDSRARRRLTELREVSLLVCASADALSRTEVPKTISQIVLPLEAEADKNSTWSVPAWAAVALLVFGIGIGFMVTDSLYGPTLPVPFQTVAWHQQAAWFHKLAAERQARSTPLLLDFEHNNPSHLTTTLINALEYPVVVPDLSRQGFELLGARVLIEDMRPLAQVFYRESNGILVSLLVALDMGPAVPAKAMAVDDFQMVAWRGERFAYVLTGDLEEERLFHLTTQVLNAVPN